MHPYSGLPSRQYWRTGISDLSRIYEKRFEISAATRISTSGSCFAQHIGRRLRDTGFNFQDFEPAPPALPAEHHARFGYGLFSARFGNVYTARQLLQLFDETFSPKAAAPEVWLHEGRAYDALRPNIEEGGFSCADEALAMRQSQHLPAVRRMFETSEVLVFTLGLTEAWVCRTTGKVYPICPGVVAGSFDPAQHGFVNFSFAEILADLEQLLERARSVNGRLQVMLTVSPVPLAATAEGSHVLTSTTYSKSVLRAVAGELHRRFAYVEYFPSYELITGPQARGQYYEDDLRTITPAGVDHVMRCFFAEHGLVDVAPQIVTATPGRHWSEQARAQQAVQCDDELLDRGP